MSPAEAYLKKNQVKASYSECESPRHTMSAPSQEPFPRSEQASRSVSNYRPQPPPGHMQYSRPAPVAYVPNHLAGAIITTLFCCLIGGIIAIVYACKVNTMLAAGDIEGARSASSTARTWIIVNIITGLLPLIIYLFVVFGAFV